MDPNHDDDHPSATNSLPLMDDDDDDDEDEDDFGVMYAIPPPLFNSNNLEPNRKLKKGVLVTVEVTTPPNTANTTHEVEIYNIIPEEEAICRFCFHQLFPVDNTNNNNVMKTRCGCPFTLTHENCVIERKGNNNNNNKCDVCDQDVSYIPVILSRASSINTKTKVVNKGSSSSSSTLKKWSYFKKGRLWSYAI